MRIVQALGHDRDQPARRGGACRRSGVEPARPRRWTGASQDRPRRRRRRAAHRRRRRRGRCRGTARRSARSRCAGPWITARYYRDPAPREVPRRLAAHRRRRHASTPNGYIQITDRAKDVIKSGGEWISSVELEGLLMAHPDGGRGGGDRRARRELGRAAARVRRASRGRRRRPPRSCASSSASDVAQVAAARAVDVHRRGAEDERRQVRQEGAPRAVRRRRARRRGAAVALDRCTSLMTTTLAASRLRTARRRPLAARSRVRCSRSCRRGSSAACSACGARSSADVLSGIFGWASAWRVAADRERARPSRVGGLRAATCSCSRCFGAMAAAVWIEFLARPGVLARAQTGLAVGAAPDPRSAEARAAGASGTRRSRASRCATGSARRSASGRKDDVDAPAPARRCGACGWRSSSAAGCSSSSGRSLSTRTDLLAARRDRASCRCSRTTWRPAPRDAIAELLEEELDAPGRRGVRRASTGSRSRRRRSARCTGRSCPTGQPVVVKVQRPGIDESVARRSRRCSRSSATSSRRARRGAREYHVTDLVDEFSDRLREELDFRIEARNAHDDRGRPARRLAHPGPDVLRGARARRGCS